MPPGRGPVRGWTGTPGSGQRSAPAGLVRPLPGGVGDGVIHARRRSSPPTVEPSHGGDEGAPPLTAIHDRFTWSLGPKIPFPRDGTVPASFDTMHDTPPPGRSTDYRNSWGKDKHGVQLARPLVGQTRRSHSAKRRDLPGRSRFMRVLTPGPVNGWKRSETVGVDRVHPMQDAKRHRSTPPRRVQPPGGC